MTNRWDEYEERGRKVEREESNIWSMESEYEEWRNDQDD